jgi:hypothetical protein
MCKMEAEEVGSEMGYGLEKSLGVCDVRREGE